MVRKADYFYSRSCSIRFLLIKLALSIAHFSFSSLLSSSIFLILNFNGSISSKYIFAICDEDSSLILDLFFGEANSLSLLSDLLLDTLLEAAALRTREVSGSEPFSLECSCWCWLTAKR